MPALTWLPRVPHRLVFRVDRTTTGVNFSRCRGRNGEETRRMVSNKTFLAAKGKSCKRFRLLFGQL